MQLKNIETLSKEQLNQLKTAKELRRISNKKIVILDDDIKITNLLEKVFQKVSNIDIHLENNEYHALNKVKKIKPDLIIIDIFLSKMNAFKFKELIDGAELSPTPVIFISSDEKQKRKIKDLKKDEYYYFIPKPLNLEKLLTRVRKTLEQK